MAGPTISQVTVPGVDGDLGGSLARPVPAEEPGGGGPRAAVVVLPEVDGLSADTEAAARRLAGAGYVALALDLYAPYGGAPPLSGPADTLAWTSKLNDFRQL